MFLFTNKCFICNYADDNTLYACNKDENKIMQDLLQDFTNLSNWFYENYLVLNADKCHFMTLGFKSPLPNFIFKKEVIKNSPEEKILGITIDNKLTFESHLETICKVANQKLNALCRLSKFTSPYQRYLLVNSYIKSQFSYCPLIWMFSSRKSNHRINKIHERSLRIILNDYFSSFEDLLTVLDEKTIHQRSINLLLIEVFKYLNNLSPKLMNEVFQLRHSNFNLRQARLFQTDVPKTEAFTNSIAIRSNQLWEVLPLEIQSSQSILEFKTKLSKWRCYECQCRICKTFIPNLGYID